VLQPGASLGEANPEAGVRFAQAKPPSVPGLLLIATEELRKAPNSLMAHLRLLPGNNRRSDGSLPTRA
jgi:hypothetical protein